MKKNVLVNLAFTGILLGASFNAFAHGDEDHNKAKDHEHKKMKHQMKMKDHKMTMIGACYGVNACKGKGACSGKTNSCAGQNTCAGKGWLKITKKECKTKKGTFKKMPM